jgi:ATP synthase protein I
MSAEEREAIRRRSSDLGRKLEEAKSPHRAGTGRSDQGAAMGRAWRVAAELIGGIVVGSVIGYFLDRWLGLDKPWFFILFFLLGATAGILNVVRSAMRERTPASLPSVKDDEDDKQV